MILFSNVDKDGTNEAESKWFFSVEKRTKKSKNRRMQQKLVSRKVVPRNISSVPSWCLSLYTLPDIQILDIPFVLNVILTIQK